MPPLTEILTISTGPVPLLRQELDSIAEIRSAFLYGSSRRVRCGVAGAAPRHIDLMVVGAPGSDAVYDACTRVEDAVRRPVNPTILTRAEVMATSGFLENVRANPEVALIGELPRR